MPNRPVLPIGATLTTAFARRIAEHHRAESEREAKHVAAALAAWGRENIEVSLAGIDFDPTDCVKGPHSAGPHDAVVALAVVHGKPDWQKSDYVLVLLAWDPGIVAANRDV